MARHASRLLGGPSRSPHLYPLAGCAFELAAGRRQRRWLGVFTPTAHSHGRQSSDILKSPDRLCADAGTESLRGLAQLRTCAERALTGEDRVSTAWRRVAPPTRNQEAV